MNPRTINTETFKGPMATRLGRWCLPIGKWERTCRIDSKGLLADADNSVWHLPPLDVDGNIAGDAKEGKREKGKGTSTIQPSSWEETLYANYWG